MIKSAIDAYMSYRFLRLLTTPWNKTPAYKVGIVDEVGNVIVPMQHQTNDQKSKYDIFDRMVYNLKRLMMKVPIIRSKIGRYATALALIKENFGVSVANDVEKYLLEDGEVAGAPTNVSGNIARTDPPLSGGIHRRKNKDDEEELGKDEIERSPKIISKKKKLEESIGNFIKGK